MSEQKEPTKEQYDAMITELNKVIKLNSLRLRVQEINKLMAEYRASELEAFAKITHFTKPSSNEEIVEHIITEEDIKNNPTLNEQGIKVGDKVGIPKSQIQDKPVEEDKHTMSVVE